MCSGKGEKILVIELRFIKKGHFIVWKVQDLFQNMLILVKIHNLLMNNPHMPLQQPSCRVCRAAVITCVFSCFSFKKVCASSRIVVA